DQWCIYPMYDYAHCISDALEGITHSLCTLEFEEHRPLYDWILDNIDIECHPKQIEFARLSLEYTLMSKRKLNELVKKSLVSGWDDPRMPTIAGMRRRGYTPASIREFSQRIGVTKVDTTIEMGVLESAIREDLDSNAPRAMAVLDPLKLVLINYPTDKCEQLTASNHPKDESMGTRQLIFSQELYIDRADFSEDPPKKYKRLIPGGEVRLRNSYVIKCEEIVKDPDTGIIQELRCSYDPDTLGKKPEGRKVKGVIHWVNATHSQLAEIRLYDRLFSSVNPCLPVEKQLDADNNNTEDEHTDIAAQLNPDSLTIKKDCRLELGLSSHSTEVVRYQFEREGYFVKDEILSTAELPVYNRIVTLRDTWAKIEKKL
ncbi:MAG: glutamine--tRNA ligase, partial [Thiohalomonadales bacterium]